MGFGQELKDFVSGFQAGAKMVDSPEEKADKEARSKVLKAAGDKASDPEWNELEKKKLRAQAEKAGRGTDPLVTQARQLRIQGLKLGNERNQYLLDEARKPRADPDAYAVDSVQPRYALGGLVKKYDEGGLVDDDEEIEATEVAEDAAVAAPERALPVGAAADEDVPAGEEVSARGRRPKFGAANDAVRDGLNYTTKRLGLDKRAAVAGEGRRRSAEGYARGDGAASPGLVEKVRQKIDPDKRMSESERNLAALGEVYEFFHKEGKPEAADRAAASMLQYFRQVSSRYAALAVAAGQEGDMDGATKAALKAYANVPDGRDMKVVKNPDGTLSYTHTDAESGETIATGIVTPEQLVQSATRHTVRGFDDMILNAAGARAVRANKPASPAYQQAIGGMSGGDDPRAPVSPDDAQVPIGTSQTRDVVPGAARALPEITPEQAAGMSDDEIKSITARRKAVTDSRAKPAAAPKASAPPRLTDRTAAGEQLTAAMDAVVDVKGESKPQFDIPKAHKESYKTIASQILLSNDVTPQDAIRAVGAMATGASGVAVKPMEGGGATITMPDKREFTLSSNALKHLIVLRGQQKELSAAAAENARKAQEAAAARTAKRSAAEAAQSAAGTAISRRLDDTRLPGHPERRRMNHGGT